MVERETGYTLGELCDVADVTQRTVRYYIQQGLLSSPGSGPSARYTQGHLDRLRLIKDLQKQHLPLSEIRSRLEGLSDAEVGGLLSDPQESPPGSAVEYVKYVLAGHASRGALPRKPFSDRPPEGIRERAPRESPDRSTWERIAVSPDIEIHVRRPLSPHQNRVLEKLLRLAEGMFKEDSPWH